MKYLRMLGSVKLAVFLLAALGAGCIVGTIIPLQAARRHVYHSPWFLSLLGLLAVNLIVCTLNRFKVWTRRYGFVISHVSILLIIAGGLVDGIWGERGMVILGIGESSNQFGTPGDLHDLPFTVRLADFKVERHDPEMGLGLFKGQMPLGEYLTVIKAGGEYPVDESHTLRVGKIAGGIRINRRLVPADEGGRLALKVIYTAPDGRRFDDFFMDGVKQTQAIGQHTAWIAMVPCPDSDALEQALAREFVYPETADFKTNITLFASADGAVKYARTGPEGEMTRATVEFGVPLPLADDGTTLTVSELLPAARVEEEVIAGQDEHQGYHGARVQIFAEGKPAGDPIWLLAGTPPAPVGRGYFAGVATLQARIKDYKSFVQVVDRDRVVKEAVVEVNHPLVHEGYSLYQRTYDQEREWWSGLEVVKAPGVPLIYTGFVLFMVGLVLALYVQPNLKRRRARQS